MVELSAAARRSSTGFICDDSADCAAVIGTGNFVVVELGCATGAAMDAAVGFGESKGS